MLRSVLVSGSCLVALLLVPSAGVAQEDTMLVLDASGSMRGRVHDETKMAIAKRVLGNVLEELPAQRRVGLIAYGHRRDADCNDIAEIAHVGSSRSAIAAAVAKLSPKGKTPMIKAIQKAAETLKYRARKATVVLISDGIETCSADPCEAAAALERAGVDLTVHVVGFDLKDDNERAQLRCIAENTGGRFFSSSSAEELSKALQNTVVAVPAPASEANLHLRATELEGGPTIEDGLAWTVRSARGGNPVFEKDGVGKVDAVIPPGTYNIEVARASDGLKGRLAQVMIKPRADKTATVALELALAANVSLDEPGDPPAGGLALVRWMGPERPGDFLAVAQTKQGPGEVATSLTVGRENPAKLRMPLEAGSYELRYVLGKPYRVLARVPLTIAAVVATLSAAPQIGAGSRFEVEFTGPQTNDDRIGIFRLHREGDRRVDSLPVPRTSPAVFRAPLEAGTYELRYLQRDHESATLARRAFEVTATSASLNGPEQVSAGSRFEVEFTGPQTNDDRIGIFRLHREGDRRVDSLPVPRTSPAVFRAPLEAGTYELRYLQRDHESATLARRAFEVTATSASLNGPEQVSAGSRFEVEFTGPQTNDDRIGIFRLHREGDRRVDSLPVPRTSPAVFRAPLEAGTYELRYLQRDHESATLARRPFQVTATTATLNAPARVPAGSTFEIAFTGPQTSDDRIGIFRLNREGDRRVDSLPVPRASPVTFRAPREAGDYELRYLQRDHESATLARCPFQVTAISP